MRAGQCLCGVAKILAPRSNPGLSLTLIACGLAAWAIAVPPAAAGVLPGSSTLIDTLDYSDTFTVGTAARPDGLYNNNGGGGYNIETAYNGLPTVP